MRIGVIPENILERLAMTLGIFPTPLAESWVPFLMARTIMAATKLGIFEALAEQSLNLENISKYCQTDLRATEKLLNALVGCGYLRVHQQKYSMVPMVKKWLLQNSPRSVKDKVLFQYIEWDWWSRCENFIKTGTPIEMHEEMNPKQWKLYQKGMRAGVEPLVHETVKRLKLPLKPQAMLDIGGSHGYWSVCFCRRYPNLYSTILDLPEAITHAAPLLERERMGDRIVFQSGDILKKDLRHSHYDFIFMSQLAHHFDAQTNIKIMKKIAHALRPGGVVGVFEPFRIQAKQKISQLGGLMDLFFAMTSEAGSWSAEEIANWQSQAGLKPRKTMRLRVAQDLGVQAAVKLK